MPIPEQQAKTSEGWMAEKWEIAHIHAAGIYDNDGSMKILCYAGDDAKHIASVSAAVEFKRGQGSNLQDPVRDARARLIAASPDLYEALKGLIPANIDLNNHNVADSAIVPCDITVGELRAARAALAKAQPQTHPLDQERGR